MACRCGASYMPVNGALICPDCGKLSPYQPVMSQAELLEENKKLKGQVKSLEKDKKFWIDLSLGRD